MINNTYDKYGFALKSVNRLFLDEFYIPHIEIKYVADHKRKNINSYGYPDRHFSYLFKAENSKETVQNLYGKIKNMDIIECTKYLLEKYPNEAESIINGIPSYILINEDFFKYLTDYANELQDNQENINYTINKKIKGLHKYINELDTGIVL